MSLQEKRTASGMSQGQLAKASGVNVRMIQFYEQGRKDINGARLGTLLQLSAALGCTVSDLLTDPELIEQLKKHPL